MGKKWKGEGRSLFIFILQVVVRMLSPSKMRFSTGETWEGWDKRQKESHDRGLRSLSLKLSDWLEMAFTKVLVHKSIIFMHANEDLRYIRQTN